MSQHSVYFQEESKDFKGLTKELQLRCQKYFAENQLSSKDNGLLISKLALAMILFMTSWTLIFFTPVHWSIKLLCLVGFALSSFTFVLGVGHDALHNAISHSGQANQFILNLCANMVGFYPPYWKARHTTHHRYVNIPGYDYDIESISFIRLSEHRSWSYIHKWQHLYAPFFYGLFTLHWQLSKDFETYFLNKGPRSELLLIVIQKCVYFGVLLGIPLAFGSLTWSETLLYFFIAQYLFGFCLALTLALAHINPQSEIVYPREGKISHSYHRHQIITGVDFKATSKLYCFLFGGFNAHIAHHLFPGVCSIHYPALSQMIQEVVDQYKIEYFNLSFTDMTLSHLRQLKGLGESSQVQLKESLSTQ